MHPHFQIEFLEEAEQFVTDYPPKVQSKILYILKKAREQNNRDLFKKLNDDIWEFRIVYDGEQYRLLAFWDKKGGAETVVIATHGFVKKSQKTPVKEIEKAEKIRRRYFESS